MVKTVALKETNVYVVGVEYSLMLIL